MKALRKRKLEWQWPRFRLVSRFVQRLWCRYRYRLRVEGSGFALGFGAKHVRFLRVLGNVSRTFRVVPLGLDPWIRNTGEHEVSDG